MGITCFVTAIASLVCLVVSIGFSGFAPYVFCRILFWAAPALSVLAFILGIIPIVRKKKSSVAVAGFVISILVLLATVLLILWLIPMQLVRFTY
ncbi:hypothetical protein GX441_05605 [bacterium]|nr:hypothetical protein [bacterium]